MTRARTLLLASLCACLLLALPATALAGSGSCALAPAGVAAEAIDDESHAGLDVADQAELGGVAVRHVTRKPRRSHRRLRVRNRDRQRSVCTTAGARAAEIEHMNLKRKRHRGKRSLMRRLMTVRGGLQA